jgi:hypothetical protein
MEPLIHDSEDFHEFEEAFLQALKQKRVYQNRQNVIEFKRR